MTDVFAHQTRSPDDPAVSVFEVTPDDATDLPYVTTGLNVQSPGTIRATMADGSVGDFYVTPGSVFPARVVRVWLNGTTATGIRGLT